MTDFLMLINAHTLGIGSRKYAVAFWASTIKSISCDNDSVHTKIELEDGTEHYAVEPVNSFIMRVNLQKEHMLKTMVTPYENTSKR